MHLYWQNITDSEVVASDIYMYFSAQASKFKWALLTIAWP